MPELNQKYVESLVRKTDYIKRKYIIDKEEGRGVKYALAVIYDEIPHMDHLKRLSKFYITMNEKVHISHKPIEKTIQKIKELQLSNGIYDAFLCKEFSVTPDVLSDINNQFTENIQVFKQN